jgi:hypothetical protein
MKFGKHLGKELIDIPDSYKYWLLDASRELILALEDDLGEAHEHSNGNGFHDSAPSNLPPGTKQILETGYRTLAKKFHADLNNGKSDPRMTELNLLMEKIRTIFK